VGRRGRQVDGGELENPSTTPQHPTTPPHNTPPPHNQSRSKHHTAWPRFLSYRHETGAIPAPDSRRKGQKVGREPCPPGEGDPLTRGKFGRSPQGKMQTKPYITQKKEQENGMKSSKLLGSQRSALLQGLSSGGGTDFSDSHLEAKTPDGPRPSYGKRGISWGRRGAGEPYQPRETTKRGPLTFTTKPREKAKGKPEPQGFNPKKKTPAFRNGSENGGGGLEWEDHRKPPQERGGSPSTHLFLVQSIQGLLFKEPTKGA